MSRASYSSLTLHRRCPQAYNYRHVMGLEQAESVPAVERDLGSWWHAVRAADSIERGNAAGSLVHAPEHLSTPAGDLPVTSPHDVISAAGSWWAGQTEDYKAAFTERLGEPLSARLGYLDDRWRERWVDDLDHERPLGVEVRWERALPALPDGTDPGVMMVGYVDEVYLDTRRSLVVVRDHKTHKALNFSTVDDMMDSQLQVYAWGASPLVSSWGVGPIRAVAYDRIRSVMPKSPAVTQAGTLSKSVTDYDLHTYLTFTASGVPYPGRKADGSGAGVYEAEESVVEKLSSIAAQAVWHQRTLVPLNHNIVRTHLRAAVDTALDVGVTVERTQQSGEAARNLTRACNWCEYASLCRAQMVGGVDGDYPLAEHGLRARM